MHNNSAVSAVVTSLLLVVIAVAAALALYLWSMNIANKPVSGPRKVFLKIEGYKVLPDGAILAYVRNIGEVAANITDTYIVDQSGVVIMHEETKLYLKPGEVGVVVLPALSVRKNLKPSQQYALRIYASSGEVALGGQTVINKDVLLAAINSHAPVLGLLANTSSTLPLAIHWVVFDYLSGHYKLYEYTPPTATPFDPSHVVLLEEGYAPIVTGVSTYDVCSYKPHSPIVIVMNPTRGTKDWVLRWVYYNVDLGVCKDMLLYLPRLGNDIETDFLVFWEDLYLGYSPTYDDWRDHIIRVTAFYNGTYRIAVYMVKGAYSHRFYLGVRDPVTMPLEPYVYQKPYGVSQYNFDGTYYLEMPNRVYYVNVGG